MSAYARGANRERQLARMLEGDGWWVVRGAGSKTCDLVALKAGLPPRLIEVKTTKRSPFSGFPPVQRREILEAAEKAGGVAELCWWRANEGPQFIHRDLWPPS